MVEDHAGVGMIHTVVDIVAELPVAHGLAEDLGDGVPRSCDHEPPRLSQDLDVLREQAVELTVDERRQFTERLDAGIIGGGETATDVEQEHNGLYFYDRRPKFDLKRLHDITAREAAFEKGLPTAPPPGPTAEKNWRVVVGALADGSLARPYRYTLAAPGETWTGETLDDSQWQTGNAPFGNALPNVRTPWNTADIWLRQNFEMNGDAMKSAALVIFYDEDTEVYVNGQKIWNRSGFTTTYHGFDVTEPLRRALKNGRNTLAVHTHQTAGGQFIDLALLCEPQP